jgi:hypothetical protein
VYRKRTTAQKEVIELMTHAGARPMQILAAIQSEDQDTLISATDTRGDHQLSNDMCHLPFLAFNLP